ncbi:c-type heme family protein [Alkalinema pantanalense CENA528]|uniref:c-type heme family protein n=1 Tax=Alkalinema pantanalense TaxID=1620705 RepID=UPI003D6E5ECF
MRQLLQKLRDLPKRVSLRLKFIAVISLCLLVSVAVGTWYLESIQSKTFEQEARSRSEIVLNFGEANRKFVSKDLRPTIETYTSDFVLEAMSATFSTRRIFEYFNELLPEYLYRQPTLNPLNPTDQADDFETQIIQNFQTDRSLQEVTGYRTLNHQEAFYIAKPIQVESSCLKCHWSPDTAPAKLVEKYGRTQGYGWKVGDIISTLMIYVPTQDLRANQTALTHTVLTTFAALAIVLIGLIYLFFDRLVNRRLRSMVRVMGQVAATPNSTTRLYDRSQDELGLLAQSFNRMAHSLEEAYADLEEKVNERTETLAQTLTELQQAQVQMVQAEKMSSLGQLVAGIAHEINNPLSFIQGNIKHVRTYTQDLLVLTKLYQNHYPQPEPTITETIETIELDFINQDLPDLLVSMQTGTERIQQIVRSLRTFARLDESELKTIDIHEGIDSTLLILQSRLQPKSHLAQIAIVKDYGDLPLVECYAGQLNQVFMSIISNAIDALEESASPASSHPSNPCQPTLQIGTRRVDQNQVMIQFTDNGPGMSEDIQKRLFDPFFTTKPIGKGTGMGLSISYQIVTKTHQGELNCISSMGTGTTFVIKIPIQQSPNILTEQL